MNHSNDRWNEALFHLAKKKEERYSEQRSGDHSELGEKKRKQGIPCLEVL